MNGIEQGQLGTHVARDSIVARSSSEIENVIYDDAARALIIERLLAELYLSIGDLNLSKK